MDRKDKTDTGETNANGYRSTPSIRNIVGTRDNPDTRSQGQPERSDKDPAVRTEMVAFWKEHSSSASLNEMMLDNNAEELHKEEMPEIMSYLPDVSGKRVIELGAGIGRFTSVFAATAASVVAVDFMQKFLNKNKATNGHHGNIEFHCADVTKLLMKNKCADLVFSNWLLMYLEDLEMKVLLQKLLEWLDEDGYLFIRESCLHPSGGNKSKTFNPTHYRAPQMYESYVHSTAIPCGHDKSYGFKLVLTRSVDTYIKHKNNKHQIVWLWQKTTRDRLNTQL